MDKNNMNDGNERIESLEKILLTDVKELTELKKGKTQEEELSKEQKQQIIQAHEDGHTPKEICDWFELSAIEVHRVIDAKRHRISYPTKPRKKSKMTKNVKFVRGSDEWWGRIRYEHSLTNGEKRALKPQRKALHDERKECPFCFDSEKYPQTTAGGVQYIDDIRSEVGRISAPEIQKAQKQRQNKDDIQVRINNRPLTDEEVEALDTTEAESAGFAEELIKAEEAQKPKNIIEKVVDWVKAPDPEIRKEDMPPDVQRYANKLQKRMEAQKIELDNLKKKYSQETDKD